IPGTPRSLHRPASPSGSPDGAASIVGCLSDSNMMRRDVTTKSFLLLAAVPTVLVAADHSVVDEFTGRPRVIVVSDIGNEPDDQMSLVRFLLYSNQFDVEALVACTSTWQKQKVQPQIMHSVIDAYGKVTTNLAKHADNWPSADDLKAKVYAGQP